MQTQILCNPGIIVGKQYHPERVSDDDNHHQTPLLNFVLSV